MTIAPNRTILALFRIALPIWACALTGIVSAHATSFSTLYAFCAKVRCRDGSNPVGVPLLANDGTLYGAATDGAHQQSRGLVFHLTPDGRGGWKKTTIYKFCPTGTCLDGAGPYGGLISDVTGNLYGVTFSGGQFNGGVVYELSPSGARVWNEKVLYNFQGDVTFPIARLTYAGAASSAPYDGTSPLYGVDLYGGANAAGQLFSLTPKNGSWSFAVLHDFCSEPLCTDGEFPWGDPLADASGNVFGTTSGTVFEFTGGQLRTIYTFCSAPNCADGSNALGGVTTDNAGNLYGTTQYGGLVGGPCGNIGCGVIYKLSPLGGGYAESVLHDFCSLPKCADGDNSDSDILMDADGNLYGTAVHGGVKDGGILFRLSGSNFTVLHDFCTAAKCADGSWPESGVTMDGSGNLFGETYQGGVNGGHGSDHDGGVVYEFTP